MASSPGWDRAPGAIDSRWTRLRVSSKIPWMSTSDTRAPSGMEDSLSGRPAEEILEAMAACVARATRFFITSHVNPDGDSLGSQLALGLALRSMGKRVRIAGSQKPPDRFAPLLVPGILEILADAGGLEPPEVTFLLDTNDPARAGPFRDFCMAPGRVRLCLDHHLPSGQGAEFDLSLVVPRAPATGSLVLALLDKLAVRLTDEMRRMLWVSIATDTGWFRFTNTTPWALRDAARLVETGVDTEKLHRQIYEEYTVPRARVLGSLLAGIHAELGGALVWGSISQRTLVAEGVTVADLDGMVDFLKGVKGAQVTALVVELDKDRHKVSLRACDSVDVERIARRFGGGGHVKAAGYRFSGPHEDLIAALLAAVREGLG